MCQNTKFNLRIIGIHKSISFFRNKYFTDQTSKFHSYRNILKIRFSTADSSGRRNRLVKFSMNPPIILNIIRQPVCICGLEFGILTIFQNLCDYRMFRCKLFQYICRSRITCLCLAPTRELHIFKQYNSKLLW